MLEFADLSVCYGKHLALDDVALSVGAGEIVVMLGANGAGKSSCLKALGGMVAHCPARASGSATLDLTAMPAHDIVEAGLALVPEDRGIFAELSVRENLLLGAYPRRARGHEAANLKRVLALFPRLAERMGQLARTMSGGEQQMLAVGRALMSQPQILLLDEPSLGLSPLMCKELFATLGRVKELGVGVLLVEQNATLSLAVGSRGYLLENGRIVGEGAAARPAERPGRAPRLSRRRRRVGQRPRAAQSRRAAARGPARQFRCPPHARERRPCAGSAGQSARRGHNGASNQQPATSRERTHVSSRPADQQRRRQGDRRRHLRPPQPDDRRGRLARRRRHAAGRHPRRRCRRRSIPGLEREIGPAARRAMLNKAADLLASKAGAFAPMMGAETGATAMWAGFNCMLAADMLREAAAMTTQITGEVIPSNVPGSLAMGYRQPVGVVLGIAPWNAPVILGVRAIAMPLACGNTVVMKASELCPGTHRLIGTVLQEAGLPAGVVNVVTNAPKDASAVVDALIAHPAVRRVNFTGSSRVGKIIAKKCAEYLKPVLLELGGKSPLVVLDDADIDEAVNAAAFGAFANQGQICMSTERIVVDEKIADAFVDALRRQGQVALGRRPARGQGDPGLAGRPLRRRPRHLAGARCGAPRAQASPPAARSTARSSTRTCSTA